MTSDKIPSRTLSAVCGLAILMPLLAPALAEDQNLRSGSFMNSARGAFDAIYSIEYQKAYDELSQLKKRYPQHPAPPLYMAVTVWLRELFEREELNLNHFLAPGYFTREADREMPEKERESFMSLLEESRQKSEAVLEKDPGNKDARYFLGSVAGIRASFAITIDRSVSQAFNFGKKAYKYHRELVEEDSEYFDAYMSVGMYEYIVGSLPWYIKWLAKIAGYSGSKKRGFEYLDIAKKKGSYVEDDAAVLQMVLYIREDMHEKALENARMMHRKYPKNFLLHINRAQILAMMGRKDEAVEVYREVLSRAEAGRGNYDRLDAPELRYKAADQFHQMGRSQAALEELRKLTDGNHSSKRRVMAHLYSARILENAGRPEEAASHYQEVLKLEPYGNSHRQARQGLERVEG